MRTNICLNMIVKDEAATLPRLLESVQSYVDYFVIVDTGSTDGTIEVIEREAARHHLDGEVHQRPWVDFGTNRQEALELAMAARRAEWLLFIDADEELVVSDPRFFEELEEGISYDIRKHYGALRYTVPHLVNVAGNRYRWEGPVHEHLMAVDEGPPRSVRDDVWIQVHPKGDDRSDDRSVREKFLVHADLLEAYLVDHPRDPRATFYLAQSYRDAGELELARRHYRARATMLHGWDEERFVAQLEVGRIAIRLGAGEEEVLREMHAAHTLRPRRAEPLYELARYFRGLDKFAQASLYAKAGSATPLPSDRLFVNIDVYRWRIWDELSIASYWIGDFETGKNACERILGLAERDLSLAGGELARVRKNLAFCNDKLDLSVPPRCAVIGTGRSGTAFMAALLGFGHEAYWHPRADRDRRGALAGDCSWMALPDIEAGNHSGPVLHVTRHPVPAVQSLVGIGFFDSNEADQHGPYRRFALEHLPAVADQDPLVAAVTWWADWNERCAAVADATLRIEDISAGDEHALRTICDVFGLTELPDPATISQTTNGRRRSTTPASRIWTLLDGRAERFGYSPG